MPRHFSVEKRHRQELKQNAAHRARRSRARTHVKALEKSLIDYTKQMAKDTSIGWIGSDAHKDIMALFQKTQSELAKAGQKGAFHRKAASRKISRLSLRIQKSFGLPNVQA